jgi:hypothetical protein
VDGRVGGGLRECDNISKLISSVVLGKKQGDIDRWHGGYLGFGSEGFFAFCFVYFLAYLGTTLVIPNQPGWWDTIFALGLLLIPVLSTQRVTSQLAHECRLGLATPPARLGSLHVSAALASLGLGRGERLAGCEDLRGFQHAAWARLLRGTSERGSGDTKVLLLHAAPLFLARFFSLDFLLLSLLASPFPHRSIHVGKVAFVFWDDRGGNCPSIVLGISSVVASGLCLSSARRNRRAAGCGDATLALR